MIGVAADDITGAHDIKHVAKSGALVHVFHTIHGSQNRCPRWQLPDVIIDTDSRFDSPATAYKIIPSR